MSEEAKDSIDTAESEVSEMPTVATNNNLKKEEFAAKALPAAGVAIAGALLLGKNHDLNIKNSILLWGAALAVYNDKELIEDVKQGLTASNTGVGKFEAVLANVLNKGTPYSGPETSSSAENTGDKADTEIEYALA